MAAFTNRRYLPLVARILLAALFIWSGIGKILDPAGTQAYMAQAGMPFTQLFWVGAIVLEVLGALSLLLGYKARWGAIALIVFTALATLIFHTNLADSLQQIMFLKNIAITGGLLMVVEYGPGDLRVGQTR